MTTSWPHTVVNHPRGGPISLVCRPESLEGSVARLLHPAHCAASLTDTSLVEVVGTIGNVIAVGDFDFASLLRPRQQTSAHPSWPDGGRAYAKLVSTPHLELWLIEWGPSTFLDLHDHGGAIGAMQIVRGNLVETFTDLTTRSPLRSRVLGEGDQAEFSADHVHEIWNAADETALSLHGYSPRLSQMTFYEHGETRFLKPIRTDTFEPEPVPRPMALIEAH